MKSVILQAKMLYTKPIIKKEKHFHIPVNKRLFGHTLDSPGNLSGFLSDVDVFSVYIL